MSLFKIALTNIAILLSLIMAQTADSEDQKTLFRESFNDLESWDSLNFPSIDRHTLYTIESGEAGTYLKAESNASASAIVYEREFNVYEFPKVRWRWKVEGVYERGNAGTKEGDDYPLRVYVIFKYDPRKAGLGQRIAYASARLRHGEYPPDSSLNYIWANREHRRGVITSSYTEKVKLVLLREGASDAGAWLTEEIDIVDDYERAFGNKPPPLARLAIMNDSDNTGERSISYIDYIEVHRE